MVLNNREIAAIIWVSVFFICIIIKKDIRNSFINVLKSMLCRFFIISFILLTIYMSMVVYIINKIGLWNIDYLKDSILWFLFVGIVISYKAISIKKRIFFFRSLLKDNLKAIVVLEFLVSTYTFGLIIEIVILPVITFIILIATFTEKKQEHHLVYKIFTSLQNIIGLLILFSTLYLAISDFKNLASINTLIVFSLPIELTLLFLPMVYMFAVSAIYNEMFVALKMGNVDNKVNFKLKFKLVLLCRINLRRLKRFSNKSVGELKNAKTEKDLDRIVNDFKLLMKNNKEYKKRFKKNIRENKKHIKLRKNETFL